MNSLPSVCIMIPTYNQSQFIIKAVESALAQDYPNLELVIANDNSTDNTEKVLQPFFDNPAIKYKRNSTNLGRVANYRKCLNEYTKAEWVINLDGDDYYTNNQFISQAMNAIISSGLSDTLFYQGVNIIKSDQEEILIFPKIKVEEEVVQSTDYFFRFFERGYFSHMSTLYSRKLAIESNFYSADIISSDIFSFLYLSLKFGEKKIIVSKNISGVWFQHKTNISKTLQLNTHWNNFRLYRKLYHFAIEKGYSKIGCFTWLTKAHITYLKSYFFKLLEAFRRRR